MRRSRLTCFTVSACVVSSDGQDRSRTHRPRAMNPSHAEPGRDTVVTLPSNPCRTAVLVARANYSVAKVAHSGQGHREIGPPEGGATRKAYAPRRLVSTPALPPSGRSRRLPRPAPRPPSPRRRPQRHHVRQPAPPVAAPPPGGSAARPRARPVSCPHPAPPRPCGNRPKSPRPTLPPSPRSPFPGPLSFRPWQRQPRPRRHDRRRHPKRQRPPAPVGGRPHVHQPLTAGLIHRIRACNASTSSQHLLRRLPLRPPPRRCAPACTGIASPSRISPSADRASARLRCRSLCGPVPTSFR